LKEYDRELKIHMYKLHYDIYLAKMKEAGVFVTKHTVIEYVNQLAPAQQLACVIATPLPVRDSVMVGSFQHQPRVKKQIMRTQQTSENSADTKSGFRNSRLSRGGRTVPSLSIQIPNRDGNGVGANEHEEEQRVKGSKSSGCVKVQNQFAGLDVDE
jgi:hypothetical protein